MPFVSLALTLAFIYRWEAYMGNHKSYVDIALNTRRAVYSLIGPGPPLPLSLSCMSPYSCLDPYP